eukprot:CAMPEP_0206576940 /NCGR_PEP_ID=MMETSP0325_2-20121206/31046_1 /ASSEMBLY_ACC=CAM_ASM_000347 /TAXON_ID=2866 /ORGANISM="Crypthecodinium cohnii, Strain Seligo" /LENGTH=231 /DNA_ID=CAMNT_0054082243 /DNA_START=156 /DNA_END=852 /DNA_ORIENTATION=-
MRQQRVNMAQFDRNALLQYHQQAITHALAPQQAQRQMPSQLVFPDDTMAIGSLAASRGGGTGGGNIFPTGPQQVQESTEDQQRRLLQSEPIVVYTSLSDRREGAGTSGRTAVLDRWDRLSGTGALHMPLIGWSHGWPAKSIGHEPYADAAQMGLYVALLVAHAFFALAMYLWNVDMISVYAVFVTLVSVLVVVLALRGVLDLIIALLAIPNIFLATYIKNLMMPHCFTVKS